MRNVVFRPVFAILFSLAAAACSGGLEHEAPYDPDAPLAAQAKAGIQGKVTLAGETDFSLVAVRVENAGASLSVQTLEDGTYRAAPLVPGRYTITYTLRGFVTQTQSVTLDIGEKFVASDVTLQPRSVSVTGSALAALDESTQAGGVSLSFSRVGGLRDASAAPRALLAAAEETDGGAVFPDTYITTSDTGGNYALSVPAGQYEVTAEYADAPSATVSMAISGDTAGLVAEPIVLRPLSGLVKIRGTYAAGAADAAGSYELSNTRTVTLELLGFNAAEMRVAEGPTCGAAPLRAYAASLPFTLSAGDGVKTVCVRYRNENEETGDITATIDVDTTAPVAGDLLTQTGALLVATSRLVLALAADDTGGLGVASVEIDENAAFVAATEYSMRPLASYDLQNTAQGAHTLYARYRDAAGNYSAAVSLDVVHDSQAPSLNSALRIADAAGATLTLTRETEVYADVDVTDASSIEYQISNNATFSGSAWLPFEIRLPVQLAAASADGGETRTVYLRFRDAAGNATGSLNATVTIDTVAPTLPTLSIASPAASAAGYSNAALVQVQLSASGAAQMAVGTDPFLTGASPLTLASPIAYALAGTDGTKTLYARFYDAAGNASDLAVDDIVLDRSAPTGGSVVLNGGAAYLTSGGTVTVTLGAADALSGLASVALSNANYFTAASDVAYETTRVWTVATPAADGVKTVWVRYKDQAGNYSAPVSASIVRDTTPPTGSFQVNGGTDYSANQFVTIGASASGDTAKIVLSNDAGFAVKSELAYTPNLVWALSPVQGLQHVYAKFIDSAGNESAVYSDAVTLDATAPVVSAFALDVTQSAASLGLSWSASLMPGVVGYNWYRVTEATTLGGFTAGTSATVVNPLSGETYAVTAVYASGLESAMSSPAVENGVAARTQALLVVDDDGGGSSVENELLPQLSAAGFAYTVLTVPPGQNGPTVEQLAPYQAVVWSTGEGNAAPYFTGRDRESLEVFLSGGGNLVLLSPQVMDETNSSDWVKLWAHTGRIAGPLDQVSVLEGIAGDPVSDGLSFRVGPPMSGIDEVYGSPVAANFLASGEPIGVRYPESGSAGYRFAFAPIPAQGLLSRLAADINSARFELPASGTPLTLGDDDAALIALPFTLKFGAQTYTQVWVGSNGVASFDGPITRATPYAPFPTTSEAAKALVAPLWTDLNPTLGSGQVFYASSASQVVIVWQDVVIASNGVPVTMGVRINSDHSIETVLGSVNLGLDPALVYALQDESGVSNVEMGLPFNFGFPACCAAFPGMALSFRSYRDQIAETSVLLGNLVRHAAVPPGVRKTVPRYFTVNSLVSDGASAVTEMRVSVDGTLDTEAWQAYDGSLGVVFGGGDGTKQVAAVYRDVAGNTTTMQSDAAQLDTQAPVVTNVLLTDANTGSNALSRTRTVTLQIVADATSADFMRSSESATFVDAGWTPYVESSTFTLSEDDGDKFVYVWVKDANGNVSAPAVGAIVADTAAPATRAIAGRIARTAPIYVNGSYSESTESLAFADLPAGDALGLRSGMRVTGRTLPFTFTFYDKPYTQLVIYNNGVVALRISDPNENVDPTEDAHEDVFAGLTVIAPLYQDLAYSKTGQDVYYYATTDTAVIQWVAEDPRSQTAINAAVMLRKDGRISYLYGDSGNTDLDPIVGISKGDGKNMYRSRYDHQHFLSGVATVTFTPNENADADLRLYYRYRYESGPGGWIDSGLTLSDVFDTFAFYPPLGIGDYDFYTVGTDSAGNVEDAPTGADTSVAFDDVAPAAPVIVQAYADDDSVFLRWDASASPDVVSYNVYYGETAGFIGTDAVQGDSPIKVDARTSYRLEGLEPGKKLFVTVTAIDYVGNESARPSGDSFVLPRALRKVATVTGSAYGGPVLQQGDRLYLLRQATAYSIEEFYDLWDPSAPRLLDAENISFGTSTWLRDLYAYTPAARYQVSDVLTYDSAFPAPVTTPFYYMTAVTPDSMIALDAYGRLIDRRFSSAAYSVLYDFPHGLGVVAEGGTAYATGADYCGPALCPDSYARIVTTAPNGTPYLSPTVINFPFTARTQDVAGGYLAVGDEFVEADNTGVVRILDVSSPAAPTVVMTASGVFPMALKWVGDRLAMGDFFGINLFDAADVTAPVGNAFVASGGYPNGLAFLNSVGVATHTQGFDVIELGELIPAGTRNIQLALAGQMSAIASLGDYAYVAEETNLDIVSIADLEGAGPVVVGRFTPFVAKALGALGHYLFALNEESRLHVFDLANPASPMLVWTEEGSVVARGAPSLVVLGSTVYLDDRAYDVSNPAHPAALLSYRDENVEFVRAGGGLLYAAANAGFDGLGRPQHMIRAYSPTEDDLNLIGQYSLPITCLADFVVDNRSIYVYQSAPASRLSVYDFSNLGVPQLRGTYPIGDLGYAPGNRYLAADRGFVYYAENIGGTRLIQLDLRIPATPVLAFVFESAAAEYITAPTEMTSRDHVLVGGSRSMSAFKISTNVPLPESINAGSLAGVTNTTIGDRYTYFSKQGSLYQIERRAPALTLNVVGTGEMAVTKRGNRLQIFDPPGVPAVALTADGTGVVTLTNAAVDTLGELCAVLNATGRIGCRLPDAAQSNRASTELLDTFGMRIENDDNGALTLVASLRTPRVRTTTNVNGVINTIRFDGHRLFLAVSGAQGGLYVVDPLTLAWDRHLIGDAYGLQVRDSMAYVGRGNDLIAYRWTSRTTVSTATANMPVRMVSLGHNRLIHNYNNAGNVNSLQIHAIAPGGALAASIVIPYGSALVSAVALAGDRFVHLDGGGLLTFFKYTMPPAPTILGEQQFTVTQGLAMKSINGKLLVGQAGKLTIFDTTTLPPVNEVKRELKIPGQVRDFDVLGDLLSVAADAGGAVTYRLK